MSLKYELQLIDQEILDASSSASFMLATEVPPFVAISAVTQEYPAFEGLVDATVDMSVRYGEEGFAPHPSAEPSFRMGAFFTILALRNYAEAEGMRTAQSHGEPDDPCLKDAFKSLDADDLRKAAVATYEKADYKDERPFRTDTTIARDSLSQDYPQLDGFLEGSKRLSKRFAEDSSGSEGCFEDGVTFVLLSLRNYAESELTARQITSTSS